MFWWVFGSVLVLIALLVITPVRLQLTYERVSENDRLFIVVTIWYVIMFKKELPIINVKGTVTGPEIVAKVENEGTSHAENAKSLETPEVRKKLEQIRQLLEKVHDLREILKDFLRHVHCEQLEWKSSIGVGEAAGTGALTGIVYGVKSMIVSMVSHYISLRSIPRITVNPEWNTSVIHTQFYCILRLRVGHAMVAGIRVILKWTKGSVIKWQTTPSRV